MQTPYFEVTNDCMDFLCMPGEKIVPELLLS